jgi:GT2 family glycosyltransferase
LKRCLPALARTTYRDIEVIVVDNGSSDGSADLVESMSLPFPVRVIRNSDNRSFSEANGQGIAVAAGTLLCLMNNDIEPITEGWLGSMVRTLERTGALAVGARLIYPADRDSPRGGRRYADLSLQHRGVDFDRTAPVPMPRPMGPGTDPLSPAALAVEDRVALTAACLLVSRDAYESVGGMSPHYDYGLEDIDLCLRLGAAGGRLVYDGAAALWHHESATRVAERAKDPDSSAARRSRNHATFVDQWGPRIYREALLDAIRGGSTWSETPLQVAVAPAVADGAEPPSDVAELIGHLRERGWHVTVAMTDDRQRSSNGTLDVVLVLDPAAHPGRFSGQHLSVAWVGDAPERWLATSWFDDFDAVLAADASIAATIASGSMTSPLVVGRSRDSGAGPDGVDLADALTRWTGTVHFGIRVDGMDAPHAGSADVEWARSLRRALEVRGHPTRVHPTATWGDPLTAREDVVVHASDTPVDRIRAGQVNLLLQRGTHGERVDGYDAVVVSDVPIDALADELIAVARPLVAARPRRVMPDDIA